jgi:hypothetical protein
MELDYRTCRPNIWPLISDKAQQLRGNGSQGNVKNNLNDSTKDEEKGCQSEDK